MAKTLGQELFECLSLKYKPPTEEEQQETLCDMVDFNFFCEKFYGEVGDWFEENHPDDVIDRADRIKDERDKERYANMTAQELKDDEDEFNHNAKKGRE